MGNNAGQLALLAAGYALGKSKRMRTALLVAAGVAVGRMTASREEDGSNSLLSGLANSSLANSAREMVVSTATKSVETLNKNLQSRTDSLRNAEQSEEDTAAEEEDQTEEDQVSEEEQESEDAEASEEASSKTKKSGGK